MAITLDLFRCGAVGFIDWLDASTRTMGAAEGLDGDAEWSEAVVWVSICQCTESELVSALGLGSVTWWVRTMGKRHCSARSASRAR